MTDPLDESILKSTSYSVGWFFFFSGSRSSCTVAVMCHIMSFIHYCFVFHLFVAFLFASPLIKPGPMRLSLLSCDLLPFDLFSFSVS